MDFALLDHSLGILRLLVITCGPLPLCVRLAWGASAPQSQPRRLLTALTLWCLLQALIAHGAGLVHRLDTGTVLIAESALFVVGIVSLLRGGGEWWAAIADWRTEVARLGTGERVLLILLLAYGGSSLWHVAAIPVVNWDSWAFHMPDMARWLQTGEFVRMEQDALRPRSAYPRGWEAICSLYLMPFGEDTLVALPNVVAWAILGLATFVAARNLSAARSHALAAAAFAVSLPHLHEHVNTLHVDLPFAAFYMAAVAFLLSFHRQREPGALALFIASLGLLCAIRTTGPAYAAALALLLFVLLRFDPPFSSRAASSSPAPIIAAAVSALFIGSFWWIKNIVDLGNPFGPVRLVGGGPARGPGPESLWAVGATALAFAFEPFSIPAWRHVAERAWSELGFPFLIILAELAIWPLAYFSSRAPRPRFAVFLVLLLAAGSVLLFIFTPTSAISGIQLRLAFPATSTLAAAGAVAATAVGLPSQLSVALAIAAVVLVVGYSRVFQLAVAASILLGLIGSRRLQAIPTALGVGIVGSGLALLLLAARERRAQGRSQYYGPAFTYLESNVDDDEPVGYLLSNRSYFFYGTNLRRKVHYVPTPQDGPTPEWFNQLRARGIRAVLLGPYPNSPVNLRNVQRLSTPEGQLVPVFGQGRPGEITVYRFPDS